MKYPKFLIGLLLILTVTGCGGIRGRANNASATPEPDFAQGVYGFASELKGVWIQVDNVQTISAAGDGKPGFIYVVLTLSIENRSEESLIPASIILVDQFENAYPSQQDGSASFSNQLVTMPLSLQPGESVTGNELYLVPESALNADLRMRWESPIHNSRIDILLGALAQP